MRAKYGYGIAWGCWLWNNKKWFLENGIDKVKFHKIGSLSEKAVFNRLNHLYCDQANKKKSLIDKLITPIWRLGIKAKKVKQNVMTLGIKKGLKESWKNR